MDIGKNIARYRKAKGLKQSELGEQIGVSAQAVSKWENGGTPDITLLPQIAQALDVTIGMLFGEPAGNWRRQAAAELLGDNSASMYERACNFLWELLLEISNQLGFGDILKNVNFVNTPQEKCHVRLYEDDGIWLSSIHQNFHYGLVMPEPADGFASILESPEEYERVFAVLGRKDRCRALMWIYGQSRPVSLRKIETEMNAKVGDALEDLTELGFVQKLEIDTENGPSQVYGPLFRCSQLPFLYFLGEFMHEDEVSVINFDMRKKPLLD